MVLDSNFSLGEIFLPRKISSFPINENLLEFGISTEWKVSAPRNCKKRNSLKFSKILFSMNHKFEHAKSENSKF